MDENQNPAPTTEMPTIAPEQPTTPVPTETPAVAPEASSVDVTTATPTPEAAEPAVANPALSQLPAHASGGNKHLIAIIVAVVVMLGLLGAVAYLYMQQNSTSIKTTENKSAQTTTAAPVTAADVDNTTKEIDDSLTTIDADKDFSSADLSDATLGL